MAERGKQPPVNKPQPVQPLDLDAEALALFQFVKENAQLWSGKHGWIASYAEVQRIKAEFRACLERVAAAARATKG